MTCDSYDPKIVSFFLGIRINLCAFFSKRTVCISLVCYSDFLWYMTFITFKTFNIWSCMPSNFPLLL